MFGRHDEYFSLLRKGCKMGSTELPTELPGQMESPAWLCIWTESLLKIAAQIHCKQDVVCQAFRTGFYKPALFSDSQCSSPAHLPSVSCEALSGLPGKCSTEKGNWRPTHEKV